jgi:ribosome-binding ATPase YchF (GTP1/OBG family)
MYGAFNISSGTPARLLNFTKEEKESVKGLMLLTMKPMIYAANVADGDLATGNDMSKKIFALAAKEGAEAVLVSAQARCEIY